MANATKFAVMQAYPGSGTMPGGGVGTLWKVFDSELVNGTAVVDSKLDDTGNLGFLLHEYQYFGLWFNAQSASGTADVKIEIIQSYNDTAANYVSPNTGGTIAASHGETAKVYTVTPVPMPRMRIRVTGNAANPNDTTITAFLYMQT